jgi:hypothetical protein
MVRRPVDRDQCRPADIISASRENFGRKRAMTGGSALYLLMCLVTFGALAWVLASVSGEQSRREAERARASSVEPKSETAVTT